MKVFFYQEFGSFWFESGTPEFLVKKLKIASLEIDCLKKGNIYASKEELSDYTGDTMDLVPLLYQTGYLTIVGYDSRRERYSLGIPNQEVEHGLFNCLLKEYVPLVKEKRGIDLFTLDRHVEEGNLEGIRKVLTALFAGITYTQENDPFENYFQAVIQLVFNLLGKYVQCEIHTFTGRIDCRVETDRFVYLFEFKRDDTAANALKQIDQKDDSLRFIADQRKLYKIGVSFDSEKRILQDWKVL